MEIQINSHTLIGKLVYLALLIVLPLIMFTACGPTEGQEEPKGPITIEHPKACIVRDTLDNGSWRNQVKGLETYLLVIGNGTRNRCHYSEITELVTCKAKSPDTLYTVKSSCEPVPPGAM